MSHYQSAHYFSWAHSKVRVSLERLKNHFNSGAQVFCVPPAREVAVIIMDVMAATTTTTTTCAKTNHPTTELPEDDKLLPLGSPKDSRKLPGLMLIGAECAKRNNIRLLLLLLLLFVHLKRAPKALWGQEKH